MANRHKDFEGLVAQEFENLGFAQASIANLVNNEGLSLEEAPRESIESMGLQAFAKKRKYLFPIFQTSLIVVVDWAPIMSLNILKRCLV